MLTPFHIISAINQQRFTPSDFIITVDSSIAGASGVNKFRIPSLNTNYRVSYWETGNEASKIGPIDVTSADYEIDFGAAGNYTVAIDPVGVASGVNDFTSFRFNNGGDKDKALTVEQWGTTVWTFINDMFYGCSNLLSTTGKDSPNLSVCRTINGMFRSCTKVLPITDNWDTSELTQMSSTFFGATVANPNVRNWIMSKVTSITAMFRDARAATPDTELWDTPALELISFAFFRATAANPNLTNWDVRKVTNMSQFMRLASAANPDFTNWVTSALTNISFILDGATSFKGSLASFDMSGVTVATSAMNNTDMGTANYDATLIAWAAQTLQPNVQFHAGNAEYTLGGVAEAARNTLLNTYGWIITDNGGV